MAVTLLGTGARSTAYGSERHTEMTGDSATSAAPTGNFAEPEIKPVHLGRLCQQQCEDESFAGHAGRHGRQRLECNLAALDSQFYHRAGFQCAFSQNETPSATDALGNADYALAA
jgi:hypothetical protein